MQEAARRLHEMGFKTLPIKPGTKKPANAHGVKEATADDAVTDAWYERHPDHGIGVSGEGFIIFDFDVHEGIDGREQMLGWKLPDTLCQTTPSGGYHMIYRAHEEVRPSVNTEIAVDVRAWGSYIVCDPTPGYCWEDDSEPAEADEAVMAFLRHVRPKNSDGSAQKAPIAEVEAVPEGGRNVWLYKEGASLRAKEVPDDEIRAYLIGLNTVKCKPPLDGQEVETVIESVLKLEPGLSEEAKIVKASKRAPQHVRAAKTLVDEHGACFLDNVPAVFDGMQWRVGWEAVERIVLQELPNSKAADRKEVLSYLNLTMPREKQANPRYIAFLNGVLDIETMDLLAPNREIRTPNVIPHDWNPKAKSDVLDGFVSRVACGDPFVESNLFEFIGLCMYRNAAYAYTLIMLGKKGDSASNGKSTYIQLLRNVLGSDNYSVLDLGELGEQFLTGNLAGKLANLGDDISSEFTRGNHLKVLKKACAGSELNADVKQRAGFKFVPYCTFVFSCNEFPRLEKPDDGLMRRLFPIRFNAKFSPDDPDFDPHFSEKLADEDVIEAAIVRGVAGLRRVIAQKQPTPNADSTAIAAKIKVDNSTVLQWLEDAELVRADFIGWTTAAAYDEYRGWCESSGVKNIARPTFGERICDYFGLQTFVTKDGGKSVRRYRDAG